MADRSEFQDTVYQMRDDLYELKTALLGTPENKELGFVERTNARLKVVEERQWKWAGLIGLLSLVGAWIARKLGIA